MELIECAQFPEASHSRTAEKNHGMIGMSFRSIPHGVGPQAGCTATRSYRQVPRVLYLRTSRCC